jgi:hypothetical protein
MPKSIFASRLAPGPAPLPTTATGKIQKLELCQRVCAL